jgi:predicted MFS family arabinose efflux permease
LAVLVYDRTHSAVATTGLFVASQFIPAFVAPVLTAHIDNVEPRRMLPLLYGVEALLFASLAVLVTHFSLAVVYVVVVADGALMLSARGVTRSAINLLLKPDGLLRAGNGLLNVGLAVAGVLGVATGGALVGAVGPATVLVFDAGSFALVGLIAATLPHLECVSDEDASMLTRLRAGLSWASSHRTVRVLITGEALAIIFFTIVVPIEVVYAKETLDTSDAGYGAFLAVWSAGQVVGGLVFVGIKSVSAKATVLLSTTLMGAAYIGMSLTSELAVACGFALLGGLGNGVQWVAVVTLVQEWTPDELQARIAGLLESAASLATGAGFILGGAIASIFSPPAAFAVAGAGVLLTVLLSLLIRADLTDAPLVSAPSADDHPIADRPPVASR